MHSTPRPPSQRPAPQRPASPLLPSGILAKLVLAGAGLAACGALMLGLAVALAWPSLPNLHAMTDYRPAVPLRVYTADHVLIGEYGEEHRNVVPFAQIPQIMKDSVLAAEDDRFYQHGGVEWLDVIRAALTNLIHMSKVQGASTITMQVARNFYLSDEKTYGRKFYELLLTYKIESQLTKDQILELYMNQIYLGHRSYGFASAARTYFGKTLDELTPAEAAMLAGIPKAPSRANPITDMKRAKQRQRYVLGRLLALGKLNPQQYQAALAQPIAVGGSGADGQRDYAVHGEYPAELARQLMYSVFQDGAYTRGIDVYTTIDSKSQQAAYRAVHDGILDYTRRSVYPGPEGQIDLPEGIENDPKALDNALDSVQDDTPDDGDLLTGVVLSASPTAVKVARSSSQIVTIDSKSALAVIARALAPKAKPEARIARGSVVYIHQLPDGTWEIINKPKLEAALVSLSPKDGSIRAMIGGFNFQQGGFNRAVQAWRQPGSNIKPFYYAAALERGLSPTTEISDEPFFLSAAQTGSKDWAPKNDDGKYQPMMTMRQALYHSVNLVSIRIMQAITPQYAQQYLARFGFLPDRWPPFLPIALGAGSATPLEVAGAYTVFANGGYRVPPFLIDHVADRRGNLLMQVKPIEAGDETARVIDPRTAWVMDDMLRGIATYGTGARAHAVLKRNDVGGKTGTTNGPTDIWFSGFVPSLETTVWMGFDQPRPLGASEFGSGTALSTWLAYMQPMLANVPQVPPPPMPQGLIQANGDYYFSEYPPGQNVASLDLGVNQATTSNGAPDDSDVLGGFLNKMWSNVTQGPSSNRVEPAPISH